MTCPACSSSQKSTTRTNGVYQCKKCEAIYGSCYLGDSYLFVLPYMTGADIPAEQTRYFDLECLGGAGITRRHGWYDTASKYIVQVG